MITHVDPAELPEAAATDDPGNHFLEAYCPKCSHVVDACCPKCHAHVEPGGVVTFHGPAQSTLAPVEFYRRLVLLLQGARNSKFMLCCYLIATGDSFADGVSMLDVAKHWGVCKGTVSKQCVYICQYLGIPPSRYMRGAETKKSYRQSNRRPQKIA